MSTSTTQQANAAPEPDEIGIPDAIDGLYAYSSRRFALDRLVDAGEPAVAPLTEILIDPTNPAQRRRLGRSKRRLWMVTDVVRSTAAKALSKIEPSGVAALTQALENRDAEVQIAALTALTDSHEAMTAETLRELLRRGVAINRRLTRQKRLRTLRLFPTYFVMMGGAFWIANPLIGPSPTGSPPVPAWKMGLIEGIVLTILAAFLVKRNAVVSERCKLISALGETRDTRMVGALAGCLADKDKEVRAAATKALVQILPLVRPEDRQHIAPDEMNALIKALQLRPDSESGTHFTYKGYTALAKAILKAFEQIGDEKALPVVEKLTDIDEGYVPRDVRVAAHECLPFLRTRAQEAKEAKTLLRASTVVADVAPETLLRPAQGVALVDSSQLLRPQQGIEEVR